MAMIALMLVPTSSFRMDTHASICHSPHHPLLYYTGPLPSFPLCVWSLLTPKFVSLNLNLHNTNELILTFTGHTVAFLQELSGDNALTQSCDTDGGNLRLQQSASVENCGAFSRTSQDRYLPWLHEEVKLVSQKVTRNNVEIDEKTTYAPLGMKSLYKTRHFYYHEAGVMET